MFKWISEKISKVASVSIDAAEKDRENFKKYDIVPVKYEAVSFKDQDDLASEVLKLVESGDTYFKDKGQNYIVGKIFDFSKYKARVGVTNFSYNVSSLVGQKVSAVKIERVIPGGGIAIWAEYGSNKPSSGRSNPVEIKIVK